VSCSSGSLIYSTKVREKAGVAYYYLSLLIKKIRERGRGRAWPKDELQEYVLGRSGNDSRDSAGDTRAMMHEDTSRKRGEKTRHVL